MKHEIDYTKTISKDLMSYEKEIYEYICSNFNKRETRILELGSGMCNLLKLLNNKFFITGVDYSFPLVEKGLNLKLDIIHMDIEKDLLFFPSKQFDIIIIAQVLEHLNNPLKVLNDIKTLLKINGMIIVSVPNSHFMTRIINNSLSPFEYRCRHINSYDTTHLINLLYYYCGYKIKEIFFSGEVFPNMKRLGKILDKIFSKTKLFRRFSRRIIIIGVKKNE